ncbi:MAG: metal-dependent hydrolase [Bacteroidales bacterium]|nr:metal-dependent hydrolase [Bacteroidales bacterium]
MKPESATNRDEFIDKIRKFPHDLVEVCSRLTQNQLQQPCLPEHPSLDGDWNIAQTIHHIADSHTHAYTRMKFMLAEDETVFKTWDQVAWSTLNDYQSLDIEPSLQYIAALHNRWTRLLESLTEADFERYGEHPEMGRISLYEILKTYARHGHGHIEQIRKSIDCKTFNS